MSDIDTAVVDSLKALDPNRPIREAGIAMPRIVQYPSDCTALLSQALGKFRHSVMIPID